MIQNPPDMKLRISADLRQKIEVSAKENNRTLNSEIVARLEKSYQPTNLRIFKNGDPNSPKGVEKRVAQLEVHVAKLLAAKST
jgi:Arc-like DNA binding domain